MAAPAFNPETRAKALESLATEHFDVLVIGGGATGVGSALDAVTRGLSTALIEARDFASGTSSRSSKLFHGGLRYLEQMDFKLVAEALTERQLMIKKICPHLAKAIPFLFPLQGVPTKGLLGKVTSKRGIERFYIGSGVFIYDSMAHIGARRHIGKHGSEPWGHHLSKKHALEVAPGIDPSAFNGGIQYFDGQMDDARHTMTVARTAAEYGATVGLGVKVTGLIREGEKVVGVHALDVETGKTFDIKARTTIVAGGVWTDEFSDMLGMDIGIKVRASKGIHIVVPKDKLDMKTGIIMRTEKSVLFIIPWKRFWIIGTTDTDWSLDREHPAATKADVQYLLDHVNPLVVKPLQMSDIVGVFCGLRPLVAGTSASTANLSREHAVVSPVPGITLIAGGKYTTYRVMGKDAVDAAIKFLPSAGTIPGSITQDVPLVGADGYKALLNSRALLAERYGLSEAQINHLLNRYGSQITEVLALAVETPELAKPIPGDADYLMAEALYAVTHEGALHLEDVLLRRTRMSFEADDKGRSAAQPVAELIAGPLGWSKAKIKEEVDHYYARLDAEAEALSKLTDEEADAARSKVPDLVPGPGR